MKKSDRTDTTGLAHLNTRPKTMKIVLEGACTVEKSEEIRQTLLRAVSDKNKTEISFANVESVDLSFFQILHAAVRSFARMGNTLILMNDLHPDFALKAERTGWQRIVADKQDE
ncbi:MAG: STAS domain-containing protein [Magnetococcus sp. YQC-5]